MRPFIVVGDRTSHGGIVISGSESTDVDGKPVARIGDRATCPRKGHGSVTTIVTGDVTAIIDGRPLARHGDKTACGATLISSQMIAYVDNESSRGQGASSAPAAAVASSLASNEESHAFDLQFLVQGDKSGKPMANTPYKITLDDGRIFTGKTDKSGLTQKVSADYPAHATLIAPYHDDDKTSTDGYCGIDSCCC
ncbi:PAAR domain-containing protein [Dechloromonas denitrificans]|uniref:PAAR domain-containing protein n=1 Tax=Dechloromonas denitrificans TaxID=281362 RepID=UPI001F0A6D57|nr:PAAR domain-containing protein [Dechloromonas denitrificans]